MHHERTSHVHVRRFTPTPIRALLQFQTQEPPMTSMVELIAFHEIAQLKYRYMRAIDTRDWELLNDCFTADARAWYTGGKLSRQGREAIVAMLREFMPPAFVSSHVAL